MSRRSQFRQAWRHSLKRLEGLVKTEKDHEHEAGSGVQAEVKVGEVQDSDIRQHVRKALAPETSTSERRIRTTPSHRLPPSPPPGRIENDDDGDDGDEEWASDRSSSPDPPDTSSTADQKKKPKAPKIKPSPRMPSHPLGSGRRGRRTSLRRSHTQPSSQSQPDHPPVIVDERGRSLAPFPKHSPIHTPISSPTRSHVPSLTKSEASHGRHSRPGTSDSVRNQRLEHIRALYSVPPTREASPSRSVWFADEAPPPSASASISMDLARSLPPTPPDEAATVTSDGPESAKVQGILEVPRGPDE